MKILILYRTEKDKTGTSIKEMKESLEKQGNQVGLVSRHEDLNLPNLSSSMDSLKDFVIKMDQKEHYDIIYTQDWSISFPLLFPTKTLFEKHFCFFHDLEKMGDTKSKVLQKIAGNLLGEHLLVKNDELKAKFPKSTLTKDGVDVVNLKK